MNFHRIECFLALAEKLNYTKAAQELYMTPQALSKQIQVFEDELGAKLFERTTRSVKLTPIGEVCYEHLGLAKAEFDRQIGEVHRALANSERRMRIGFFSALPKDLLIAPVLSALQEEFPQLDFDLVSGTMEQVKDWLEVDEIDVCITNAHDFEDWRSCMHVNFSIEPAKIVVGANHPWVQSGKKFITDEDMAQASVVLLKKEHPYEFNSAYKRIKYSRKYVVDDFDSMLTMLMLGRDYAIFPLMFSGMDTQDLRTFDLPPHLAFNYRTMAACRQDRCKGDVRAVMNFLKETRENYITTLD